MSITYLTPKKPFHSIESGLTNCKPSTHRRKISNMQIHSTHYDHKSTKVASSSKAVSICYLLPALHCTQGMESNQIESHDVMGIRHQTWVFVHLFIHSFTLIILIILPWEISNVIHLSRHFFACPLPLYRTYF